MTEKEMTPKEALRRISGFISFCCQEYFDKELEKDWKKDIEAITQALNRFEQLEKENQELKNKNTALKIKVRAWEIQGKKYKKVIDILKSKKVDLVILLSSYDFKEYNANITIRINGVTYLKGNNYILTQQEFDLLKEMLESE